MLNDSIFQCHGRCVQAFDACLIALEDPVRDFSNYISSASIAEDYGRFKVWRGNVGARHEPSRHVSLDFRLRDAAIYRDKIVDHLIDLAEALENVAELVRGEREPIEETYSPTASSAVSESDADLTDDDLDDEATEDHSSSEGGNNIPKDSMGDVDAFAMLKRFMPVHDQELVLRTTSFDASDALSLASAWQEPEIQQLRNAIVDILAHLYKLATFIRQPVPHDRLKRASRIDVEHFKSFDEGYVRDCFPAAPVWLQARLAKAITRRRQRLIYSRKHHRKLATADQSYKPALQRSSTNEELRGTLTAPATVVPGTSKFNISATQIGTNAPPLSTRFASTRATEFVPNLQVELDREQSKDFDLLSVSTGASLSGAHDAVHIPPRPRGLNGEKLDEFECPYCFCIQNIDNDRIWKKHVLTDLTPYVCTFEDCSKTEVMFESRSEWFTHELQFHRREWSCGTTGHKVYRSRPDFATHLSLTHSSEFSAAQISTFISSCERAVQLDVLECPLCTEDRPIPGTDGKEPTLHREPRLVPARSFKRHVGRHLDRLALFAVSSAEEDHDDEASLSSDNLNSGVSALSWMDDDDDSSNSGEGPTEDREINMLENLLHSKHRPTVSSHSGTASVTDELPAELAQVTESMQDAIRLPCRDISIHSQNPNFVGRRETLATLHESLDPLPYQDYKGTRIFTLCGPGGMGKTQAALSYVFEVMDQFDVVLWAHASTQVQLIHSFSNFAAELGLFMIKTGKEEDPTIDALRLKEWFNNAAIPWLLIIDSADDIDVFDEYIPAGQYGSILITSRDATLISKYGGMTLGILDKDNAIQMLVESIGRQGWIDDGEGQTTRAAADVVQRLGYFPLAINDAAHYVASSKTRSLAEFIAEYERNELARTASAEGEVETGASSAADLNILWRMSFDSLTLDQQKIVNTLSFFDPTGIPLDMITDGARGAKGHGSEFVRFLQEDSKFRECIAALTISSVLILSEDSKHLWMHQLYQESSQNSMDPSDRQLSWNQAVALADGAWPIAERKKRRRADLWETHARLLPHVQSLDYWYRIYKDTAEPIEIGSRFVHLLVQAANFCLMRGFFDPISGLLETAHDYCSQYPEDGHLLLFDIFWVAGGTALQLNSFDAGATAYEQAFAILQQAVDKSLIESNHECFAIASGLMGNGRMALNDFAGAEEWYLRAFQLWEPMDDRVFLDKQLFVANMTICLAAQGKYLEAEELMLPKLQERDTLRGFKLADSLYTLANVRVAQRNLEGALVGFKEAYTIFRDALGERHRLTANCCYCLAWIFNRQRKYGAAITMYEQALASYAENSYYQNERIRTKYMLGCVQLKHGDSQVGQALIDEARMAVTEIKPQADAAAWTEDDYDLLVMPWSR